MKKNGFRIRSGLNFRRRKPPGSIPGGVVADPNASPSVIRAVSYGPDKLTDRQIDDPEELRRMLAKNNGVTWVDVEGLGSAATIRKIGEIFGIHSLTLEDVVSTHQRPKVEDYDEYMFVVARMIVPSQRAQTEQLSMIWGKDFVITFQERRLGYFSPVRARIEKAKGRIRRSGPDYLAYALLDAVVDAYFPSLEDYGDRLERLEEEMSSRSPQSPEAEIRSMRSELLMIRRAIMPLRDELRAISVEPSPLITDETRIFFRDCHDHTMQILDLVVTSRELCAELREHYQSVVNTRINHVMSVLTIVATIFIPLSFLTSLYGMNFDGSISKWNMPELRWEYGYPVLLCVMALIAGGGLFYFWRQKWFK